MFEQVKGLAHPIFEKYEAAAEYRRLAKRVRGGRYEIRRIVQSMEGGPYYVVEVACRHQG